MIINWCECLLSEQGRWPTFLETLFIKCQISIYDDIFIWFFAHLLNWSQLTNGISYGKVAKQNWQVFAKYCCLRNTLIFSLRTYLGIRWFCPRERRHVGSFVIRAFLQTKTIYFTPLLMKKTETKTWTYIANHGDVSRLRHYSLHVTGAFGAKKRRNTVTNHVGDDTSRDHSVAPRVIPTHHQRHVGEDIGIAINLKQKGKHYFIFNLTHRYTFTEIKHITNFKSGSSHTQNNSRSVLALTLMSF